MTPAQTIIRFVRELGPVDDAGPNNWAIAVIHVVCCKLQVHDIPPRHVTIEVLRAVWEVRHDLTDTIVLRPPWKHVRTTTAGLLTA